VGRASRASHSRPRPALRTALVVFLIVGLAASPAVSAWGASPTPVPSSSLAPSPSASPSPARRPKLSAPAAILEDLDTGKVLFARAPEGRRPIASLTKIMTAFVVLSSVHLDDVATVPAEAVSQIGVTIGLRRGEHLTVRDLLYGMLLPSGNDAAVTLARFVGGTVDAFVAKMNATAARMGLRDTHFASPTGLDDKGYSTPADLARLTRRTYRNETFARIVATVRHRIPGPKGSIRRLLNRNILLRVYPGAIGVKTGFTTRAGDCLIGAARLMGFGLLAVVLGSRTNAFDQGIHLLNFGFGTFERVPLLARGDVVQRITLGNQAVDAIAARDVTAVVRKDRPRTVGEMFIPDPGVVQPVVAGERIGRIQVLLNDRPVATVHALAALVARTPPPPPPTQPTVTSAPSALLRAILFLAALIRAALHAFL
jgi:serine-type D-Ala-D-Ala carboxypeptidase (penicillin-binding protein 5/6)